jgi:hypothetical protein
MEKSKNILPETPLKTLHLESASVKISIAEDEDLQLKGLSGIEQLPSGYGLFFVFKEEGFHGIWMKDMKFPIDIIWMDKKLQVIDIKKDISPDTYPELFYPQTPALFVLEVEAGFSIKNNVKVGTIGFWGDL